MTSTSTTTDPKHFFNTQLINNNSKLKILKKRSRLISTIRITVFLITVIGIYISVAYGYSLSAMLFSGGFIVFIFLIKVHSNIEKKIKWAKAKIEINKNEEKLLAGNTIGFDTGKEYLNSNHPYCLDLDIFGDRSLFQLINRTVTPNGKKLLANRLNNLILDINELKNRQTAINELKAKANWRQNFQTTGKLTNEKVNDQNELLSWALSSDTKFDTIFYKIMLFVNPILGFSVITLIYLNILTISSFFLFLLLPLILVGGKMGLLNKVHVQLSKKSELLLKYSKLFKLISNENFNSPLLINIKNNIVGKHSAKNAIKELSNITKVMDYRLNIVVGILLNIFFLWDIKQTIRIEKWKKNYAEFMQDWLDNLTVTDELQSFAGFAFNFPKSTFPNFKDGDFTLTAKNVMHPFINQNTCVGNNINFTGWQQFHIITGANMAGKSTYLRTMGINMVIALTGAPVLADEFIMVPVNIFTGIKTTDSLQDGESYFFAELVRLKNLITNLETGNKLFVILDEVLRGTNSVDKQKGSKALITQLIKLNASGMIATHDLELGKLIDQFPKNVINKRFEVEIENNELVFDYKLKDGISQNLNATFLMKKMGIIM